MVTIARVLNRHQNSRSVSPNLQDMMYLIISDECGNIAKRWMALWAKMIQSIPNREMPTVPILRILLDGWKNFMWSPGRLPGNSEHTSSSSWGCAHGNPRYTRGMDTAARIVPCSISYIKEIFDTWSHRFKRKIRWSLRVFRSKNIYFIEGS